MITITNTENLLGVAISGDYDDLNSLVDAFHEITVDEYSEKHQRYIGISTRVLGLCYDVRHAYQGDREVEFVDNNMTEDKMKWHSVIAPKNNVYYSCNYLYPEMFVVMLALNELIELRIKDLTKTKFIYKEALDKKVIWDETIAIKYSEYEHLEKILLDSICTEPIEYIDDLDQEESPPQGEKYQKYKTDYKPVAHEYRADDGEKEK